jgi:O-antigen ligase
MCVVWPIAMMLLFAKLKGTWRVFLLVCSLVFLVGILVCGSRGAVVGAACVVLAALVASRKKLAALVMALLMLPGIMFILPGTSKERMRSAWQREGDPTVESRLVFWRAGLEMFRDHPILGVGLKNFPQTRLRKYAELGWTTKAWVPHSVYIEILSELGLAGTIPVLALFVLLFRLNAKTRQHLLALGPVRRSSFEYALSMGLDLGFVGFLGSGAFVAVFRYPHIWVLLGLTVGLYTACQARSAPPLQNLGAGEQARQLQGVAS